MKKGNYASRGGSINIFVRRSLADAAGERKGKVAVRRKEIMLAVGSINIFVRRILADAAGERRGEER